jgi:hypothetical protein
MNFEVVQVEVARTGLRAAKDPPAVGTVHTDVEKLHDAQQNPPLRLRGARLRHRGRQPSRGSPVRAGAARGRHRRREAEHPESDEQHAWPLSAPPSSDAHGAMPADAAADRVEAAKAWSRQ